MGIENRKEHRHTLALETEVHFQENLIEGMFRCRSKNIGLGGVFLPADNMPINSSTSVELVFLAKTQPVEKQYRLQAQVVWSTTQGAALSFMPLSTEQRQDFRRFLFHAKVAARH